MKVRSSFVGVLLLALVAHTPSAAHAQARESAEEPAAGASASASVQWGLRAPPPIDLRVDGVWRTASVANAPIGAWFAPKPAPIRLSQTAITAIIIGGVVLVVLVVRASRSSASPARSADEAAMMRMRRSPSSSTAAIAAKRGSTRQRRALPDSLADRSAEMRRP